MYRLIFFTFFETLLAIHTLGVLLQIVLHVGFILIFHGQINALGQHSIHLQLIGGSKSLAIVQTEYFVYLRNSSLLLVVGVAEPLEDLGLEVFQSFRLGLLLVHFLHLDQQLLFLLSANRVPPLTIGLLSPLFGNDLPIRLHILHAQVLNLLLASVLLVLLAEGQLPLLFEGDCIFGLLAGGFDQGGVHEPRMRRLDGLLVAEARG